ncbi:TRAP transporter small permease subunit [Rhodobaculum claviforme]|uniref:TRAP transporter small permease protein n=1 Tax=Rhodobaculum claviforme TaxID=1549854 RepID=A0A934WES6_9RHOB|nr:TRAP transporter small permease [Rhodobaculum claviforme]MBK5926370.1 C4-dicarboxylate ABC transporter substrate-binding protein [Rhodobaculum claviforme]
MATQAPAAGWRRGSDAVIRGIGWISTVCGWVAASMILASVLITCQMIFVRFVLRQSTIWQTETVIYLMVAATMLGLPYVQKLRGHVNVDLVPMALRGTPRKVLAVLVLLSGIGVLGLIGWYGYENWQVAFDRGWRSSSVWGPPLWIPYAALPVGFGLMILQLFADLLALLTGRDTAFGLEDD